MINSFQIPKFKIPGDQNNIMLEKAELRAIIKTKALWIAGFMSESEMAKIYGCSVKKFWWLICNKKGDVLDKYVGFYMDLSEKFKKFLK